MAQPTTHSDKTNIVEVAKGHDTLEYKLIVQVPWATKHSDKELVGEVVLATKHSDKELSR